MQSKETAQTPPHRGLLPTGDNQADEGQRVVSQRKERLEGQELCARAVGVGLCFSHLDEGAGESEMKMLEWGQSLRRKADWHFCGAVFLGFFPFLKMALLTGNLAPTPSLQLRGAASGGVQPWPHTPRSRIWGCASPAPHSAEPRLGCASLAPHSGCGRFRSPRELTLPAVRRKPLG